MNAKDAQELPAVVVKNVISKEDIEVIHNINKTATTNHNFIPSGNYHKVTFLQSSINEIDEDIIASTSAFEELGGSDILTKIGLKIEETDAKYWNFLTKTSQTENNCNNITEQKCDFNDDENSGEININIKDNKYGIDLTKVNYRVIEYHSYCKFGGLMQKYHYDGGSILTAVIMLSNPINDFEGGELMSWQPNKNKFKIFNNISQCDMLLFPSHKYHA